MAELEAENNRLHAELEEAKLKYTRLDTWAEAAQRMLASKGLIKD